MAGILGVAIGTCCFYVKSLKATEPVITDQLSEETDASEDDPAFVTTEDNAEIIDVEGEKEAVYRALSQYVDYLIGRDAWKSDVLYEADYSLCNVVTVVYEYVVDGDASDLLKMQRLYSLIMQDGDFLQSVTKEISERAEYNTLCRILTLDASTTYDNETGSGGFIIFTGYLPADVNVEGWIESLDSAVYLYDESIRGDDLKDSISYTEVIRKQTDGEDFQITQNNRINEVVNAKNTYESTFHSLRDSTQAYVNGIIQGCPDSHSIETYMKVFEKTWKEQEERLGEEQEDLYEEARQLLAEQKESDVKDQAVTEKVEISEKQNRFSYGKAAIGFFIGILLYGIALFLWMAMTRRIHDEDEICNICGIRNFGGVYDYPYRTKWKRFIHDRHIYQIRRKNGKTSLQIADDLNVKLDYLEKKELAIISVGELSETESGILDQQRVFLEENGKKVRIDHMVDVLCGMRDECISGMKTVCLVFLSNKTRYADLRVLFDKLREYEIQIVGSEFIEV